MANVPVRRPANYIDPAELAKLVRRYRRTKTACNELGAAIMKIAGGVWDRFKFTTDRDDFVGDVCLHILGNPLANADPKQNLFNYFTTCAVRYGLKLRDKTAAEHRRFGEYAQDLIDSGVPLPGVNPGVEALLAGDVTEEFHARKGSSRQFGG